jgi:hypothetical protein
MMVHLSAWETALLQRLPLLKVYADPLLSPRPQGFEGKHTSATPFATEIPFGISEPAEEPLWLLRNLADFGNDGF